MRIWVVTVTGQLVFGRNGRNLTDLVCSPRLVGGNADIIPSASCVQNDQHDGDDHHDDHDGKRTSGSDDNDDHAMPSRTS